MSRSPRAAGVVSREDQLDAVVDVEDLRVVIHFLGEEGDPREDRPGLGEIGELEILVDRVSGR